MPVQLPKWGSGVRILVVGDGDFSFGLSLARAGGGITECDLLVVTSYDTDAQVRSKYGAAAEGNIAALLAAGAVVLHGVDAARMASQIRVSAHGPSRLDADEAPVGAPCVGVISDAADSTTSTRSLSMDRKARREAVADAVALDRGCLFDVAMFNNPLLSAEDTPKTQAFEVHVSNRALLVQFLRQCARRVDEGALFARDAHITVKEVYPYSWWRVPGMAAWVSSLDHVASTAFPCDLFEGYLARNVERNTGFPLTNATTHVFRCTASGASVGAASAGKGAPGGLSGDVSEGASSCSICRKSFSGPKMAELHRKSKNHRKFVQADGALSVFLEQQATTTKTTTASSDDELVHVVTLRPSQVRERPAMPSSGRRSTRRGSGKGISKAPVLGSSDHAPMGGGDGGGRGEPAAAGVGTGGGGGAGAADRGVAAGTFVAPGERLGQVKFLKAGKGTYARGEHVYASVTGMLYSEPDGSMAGRSVVRVALPAAADAAPVPMPGDIVTCRVDRLTQNVVNVSILLVGERPLFEPLPAIIRKEHVRAVEIDTLKLFEAFRSGDIVRAEVASLGDARSYFLSTAKPALGVVFARSETGAPLVPVSWKEMQDPTTGAKELRKVAKQDALLTKST